MESELEGVLAPFFCLGRVITTMDSKYDIFIAHSFEDKDTVARPIAEKLSVFGVRVWFDEFALKVGDSLSHSIDKGLLKSTYGAVILSQSFFNKGWTQYELRGLISKEIGNDGTILPIWHEISQNEVFKYSPTLADKVALETLAYSLDEIVLQLLRIIKPSIFNNISRYVQWKKIIADGETDHVPLSNLVPGRIRHKQLSTSLLIRAKIINHLLGKFSGLSLEQAIDGLKRDLYPSDEIQAWEKIAATFLDMTSSKTLTEKEKIEIFSQLLSISIQTNEDIVHLYNNGDDKLRGLIFAYVNVIPQTIT